MDTNQVIQRPFLQHFVFQRTKDGYFNATDFVDFFNKQNNSNKRIREFLDNKNTIDFVKLLEEQKCLEIGKNLNSDNCSYLEKADYQAIKSTRGKNGGTWIDPLLMIDLAMWLSPEFKYAILKFVNDNLILFRIEAGDKYKDMCKALADYYIRNKNKKPSGFAFQHEIEFINKLVFGIYEGVNRNNKKEVELKLLNELQILNTEMLNKDVEKDKRREKLVDYCYMFKIINKTQEQLRLID